MHNNSIEDLSDTGDVVGAHPLFSIKTLADFWGVSKSTVNKWRQQGRLPTPDVHLGERLIRWKPETIYNLVANGQVLN